MNAVAKVYPDKVVLDDFTLEKMINNLKYLFNIESGNHLIFVLGYGHCHSNDEALKLWVIDHVQPNVSSNKMFEKLVSALQVKLNIV